MPDRMKLFISILLLFCTQFAISQNGFKTFYFTDSAYSTFSDVLVKNDTIICVGKITINDEGFKQGLFLAKLDTNGNVLSMNTRFDENKAYSNYEHCEMKYINSSFYFVGDMLDSTGWSNYLASTNSDGHIDSIHIYAIPKNIYFRRFLGIENLDSAIFLIGMEQLTNFKVRLVVNKVDYNGNIIWQKKYGDPTKDNFFFSSLILGDTLLIGSNIEEEEKGWIFGINTNTGEKIWEWISSSSYKMRGVQGMAKGGDKKIILCGTKPYFYNMDNSNRNILAQLDIMKNEVDWITEVGQITDIRNRFFEMTPHGNGYIACGTTYRYLPDSLGGNLYIGSLLVKVNKLGQVEWERLDTTWLPMHNTSATYAYSIDTLSSGSIVVTGEGYIGVNNENAYLMKLDKNGCLMDSCNLTSINSQDLKPILVNISPNPTIESITVSMSDDRPGELTIINSIGRIVLKSHITDGKVNLDIGHLISGVYYLSVTIGNNTTLQHFIKI